MVEHDRLLSSRDGYELNERLKVTALRMMMVGRARDKFEEWEDEFEVQYKKGEK